MSAHHDRYDDQSFRGQKPWAWVLSFLAPQWKLALVAAIAVTGSAASLLIMARGAQYLVDKSLGDPTGQTLNMALLLMIGAAVLMAICSYLRSTSVNALGLVVTEKMRERVFAKILDLDARFHSRIASGDLVSRLSLELGHLQIFLSQSLPGGVRNALLLFGGMALMAWTSPQLSLLTFLAVPLLSIPVFLLAPRLRRMNRELNALTADKIAFLNERLAALRTAQLFAAEDRMNAELAQHHNTVSGAHNRVYATRGLFAAIIIVIVFSLIAFILWSGGRLVLEGQMSQGEVAAFVMYAVIAAASLATLTEVGQSLGQTRAALERLLTIMLTDSTLTVPAQPKDVPKDVPDIAFENVSFAYGEDDILHDLSFAVKPRETLALVGPSGAGKSTIFALLTRLYDPQSGRITMNGTDIRDFDPRELRRLFGVIPQEPDIFALSVAENISFGLNDMAQDTIAHAATLAHAASFIEAMPNRYDSVLGERGEGLSVGQKQRLAIARALLRDPKILLMDEATSALDAESERLVHEALEIASKDRTALVIAHRLATIRSADRILVLEKGRLVAQGTHDSLLAENGLYAHLASLQFAA